MMKLRRKKSGVKTNVERSSSHGRCGDWRTRAERKRSIRTGMTKKIVRPMRRRSGAEWRLTMGAGGAHLQATSDPGKEGRDTSAEMGSLMMEKWKKTRKNWKTTRKQGYGR